MRITPLLRRAVVGAAVGVSGNSFRSCCAHSAAADKEGSSAVLQSMRKDYSVDHLLDEKLVEASPFALFSKWFGESCRSKTIEPNAMCLSTAKNNHPSSRFVLLKDYDERGFVWYTNYESRKAGELEENPFAAITFWWGGLEMSVRIEGKVEKVSDKESDEYFSKRPRASQIGAWASNQSREIASREALDQLEIDATTRFQNVAVIPRPPHWGGFRLVPTRIEFWKGRHGRMHDRIVYLREDIKSSSWDIVRLQP